MMNKPHFHRDIENPVVERELRGSGKPSLFNLADDPYEKTDLAARFPDRTSRMIDQLDIWFERVESERKRLSESDSLMA
jgi:hypothetical protein